MRDLTSETFGAGKPAEVRVKGGLSVREVHKSLKLLKLQKLLGHLSVARAIFKINAL